MEKIADLLIGTLWGALITVVVGVVWPAVRNAVLKPPPGVERTRKEKAIAYFERAVPACAILLVIWCAFFVWGVGSRLDIDREIAKKETVTTENSEALITNLMLRLNNTVQVRPESRRDARMLWAIDVRMVNGFGMTVGLDKGGEYLEFAASVSPNGEDEMKLAAATTAQNADLRRAIRSQVIPLGTLLITDPKSHSVTIKKIVPIGPRLTKADLLQVGLDMDGAMILTYDTIQQYVARMR